MLAEIITQVSVMEPSRKNHISRQAHSGIAKILEGYFQCYPNLEVPFTRLAAERLIAALKDERCSMTLEECYKALEEVIVRLWDELEGGGHFYYIPIKQAALFERSEPFGAEVLQKFPKLTEDIQEAHRCYACGLYTACVFHLMRVMEHGVQRLGKRLHVPINVKTETWNAIANQINAKVRTLSPKSPKTKIYAEIASHLYNVRVAWRNEVMHPKATYTEKEADMLLGQVGAFMQRLATLT
jgi:hypothetical protein